MFLAKGFAMVELVLLSYFGQYVSLRSWDSIEFGILEHFIHESLGSKPAKVLGDYRAWEMR